MIIIISVQYYMSNVETNQGKLNSIQDLKMLNISGVMSESVLTLFEIISPSPFDN